MAEAALAAERTSRTGPGHHKGAADRRCLRCGPCDQSEDPLGVKGLAEIGICGVVPAIVAAVRNATGRWSRTVPLTPDKLLA